MSEYPPTPLSLPFAQHQPFTINPMTKLNIDFSKILIVNERPEEMPMEVYRLHRKAYKAVLKLYKREGISNEKLYKTIPK